MRLISDIMEEMENLKFDPNGDFSEYVQLLDSLQKELIAAITYKPEPSMNDVALKIYNATYGEF